MASLGSFQPRSFTSSSWSSCTRPTSSVGNVASAWLAVGPSCRVRADSCLEGLLMLSVSGTGTRSWYATPELSAMAVYGGVCRQVVGAMLVEGPSSDRATSIYR
jgi:hypothetical protein